MATQMTPDYETARNMALNGIILLEEPMEGIDEARRYRMLLQLGMNALRAARAVEHDASDAANIPLRDACESVERLADAYDEAHLS